jgi:tetratricopeptide (TPR) repeat protein
MEPISILIFLFPAIINAQAFRLDRAFLSIDSLKKALPSLYDSPRVDCLNELAHSYTEKMELRFTDSALAIVKQAYAEASSINYVKGLGDACLGYGLIYSWQFYNSEEREKYYREAISWHQKIQNNNGLGFGLWGLGDALFDKGAIDEANKTYQQSAFYFRKAGNEIMLADLIDRFGYIYAAKGDLEKQFEFIKKGLREKKRIGDKGGMLWSFYRLAHIYRNAGDYETALDYFRRCIQQGWRPWRSMGNIFLEMRNYDSSIYYFQKCLQDLPYDGPALAGLGKLFMLRKEYDIALSYLEKAIITFRKRKDEGGMIGVMVDIGKSYAGLKQYSKALQYAKESLTIAKRMDSKEVMQNAYEIYWRVFDALQQKDSAYFYYQHFVTLRDTLYNAKFKRQHLQKLALYKVEAKEEQQQAHIDLLNKDNQLKKQQLQEEALMKKIFAGSLIALVLLAIVLFRNIALKRKNEKRRRELAENELQMQKLESDKTNAELQRKAAELEMQALRAQMNPHFIFNCLSSINGFILKNKSEPASDYLTKFSRLIRMVLTNSKKAFISLEGELEMLGLYLEMERLRFQDSFEYNIIFKNEIDPGNIFIPPLLLQPFAENAIWHGLLHKQGYGHLDIALSLHEKILTCIITDDGIGRNNAAIIKSKSAEKQKSMGLQITTERLTLLNRNIETQTFFEIEDITDDEGNATGTRIILKIHYKDMVEGFS